MFIDEWADTYGLTIPDSSGRLHDMREEALVIGANNVYTYFTSRYTPGDSTAAITKEFPNIAPLGPAVWVEFTIPFAEKPNQKAGALLLYDERAEGGWVLQGLVYARNSRGTYCPPLGVWLFYLGPGGSPEEDRVFIPQDTALSERLASSCSGPAEHRNGQTFIRSNSNDNVPYGIRVEEEILFIALVAVTFAHCKGTVLAQHDIPPKIQKARVARGKRPLVTYRTIDIRPATTVLGTHADSRESLARALHICRGHFAHYTADRPLFGKVTGTFFVPMHVRGSTQSGQVHKRYAVSPRSSVS